MSQPEKATAIEKCPLCGAPLIFAMAGRGRVAFDAVPVAVGVPRYGDLASSFPKMRVVDLKRAHRPHSESCNVATGRAAHVAGANDNE